MIIILIISRCTENSNIISGQNDSKMVKAHAEIQKRGAKPSPQVYLLRPPLGDIHIYTRFLANVPRIRQLIMICLRA